MNHNLDNKLCQWADSRRATPEHTSRLAAAIISARKARPDTTTPAIRRHHLLWAGLAAAVAASVVTIAVLRQLPVSPAASLETLLASEQKDFDREHQRLSRLFQEAEALFGSQLHWLSQSGNTTELGIGTTPPEGAALTLRLTLVSRSRHDNKWQRLWSSDIVACGDEYLEITPDSSRDTSIQLWMHLLNDSQIFVESQLDLAIPEFRATTTSEVLRFGEVRAAARLTDNGTEYLLLQTAAPAGDPQCNS